MRLRSLEISGFKSFAKKTALRFDAPITAIVGPNGSGKSNVAESFRFVLGEQSMKSLRGKRGEDLIFNGNTHALKSNRGSVKVIFDNADGALGIDFSEVTIERIVHRDGVNEYLINGSRVRLRDIIELVARAHIGASGHHIISQGEADRILNASLKERRSMIEEALGLKVYEFKKQESEKKLGKTEENIRSVESLLRELAPHIKFLKKQLEKLERAETLRNDLRNVCLEYFKRESAYLSVAAERIARERREPEEERRRIQARITEIRTALAKTAALDARAAELLSIEEDLRRIRDERGKVARELGRVEGVLDALEASRRKADEATRENEKKPISFLKVEKLLAAIVAIADRAVKEATVFGVESFVLQIRHVVEAFIREETQEGARGTDASYEAYGAQVREKNRLEEAMARLLAEEQGLDLEYRAARKTADKEQETGREMERELMDLMQKDHGLHARVSVLARAEEERLREERDFKRDLGEVAALLGRDVVSYADTVISDASGAALTPLTLADEDRELQRERRRAIERARVRLEENGGGSGAEIRREYEEVTARESFLSRELADLCASAHSLRGLIVNLGGQLDRDFKEGVAKINKEFQEYFSLMFGGGSAFLSVVRERKKRHLVFADGAEREVALPLAEENAENGEPEAEGMTIEVSLPRKRVGNLDMLSGGERALTSIALIFAISQVNPPPFLILDETDAALDEANSRKYGDMIANLSQRSQLILITHNRETMSRAGVLYGVTMGGDGISQLLSVRFDEAVAVAK